MSEQIVPFVDLGPQDNGRIQMFAAAGTVASSQAAIVPEFVFCDNIDAACAQFGVGRAVMGPLTTPDFNDHTTGPCGPGFDN